MQQFWITLASAAGSAVLAMLTSLLTGKTFKTLFVDILEYFAKKTGSKKDDELVEVAREDLGLPPEQEDKKE